MKSHHHTTIPQHSQDPWQVLHDLGFQLGIRVILLALSMMSLLPLAMVTALLVARISSILVRLLLMASLMLMAGACTVCVCTAVHWWHDSRSALQIDVHATSVRFSGILKAQFTTDLLHARFDLLNVVHRVISLADNANHRHLSGG